MENTIATKATAQNDRCILPQFRRFAMGEGILKADGAIRKDKGEGYFRHYYPEGGIIEEIGPTGIKVKFSFDRVAFSRLEREEPRKAAVFCRYNAEMFGSVPCDIAHLARLYESTPAQIKREIHEAERKVLRIISVN